MAAADPFRVASCQDAKGDTRTEQVAIAMGADKASQAPGRDGKKEQKYQLETGRIYHDEHFVMGSLVSNNTATNSVVTSSSVAVTTTGRATSVQRVDTAGIAGAVTSGGAGQQQEKLTSIASQDLNAICDKIATGDHQVESGEVKVILTSDLGMSKANTQLLRSGTNVPRTSNPGLGMVVGSPSIGAPMPKWPANWQSAAFEAVAVKKSYILSPPEIFAECAHHGEEKSKYPLYKMLFLSIVAGCYVCFGYTTCLMIGGLMNEAPSNSNSADVNVGVFRALFGAMGFPFGFATIIVCGGELFTSICAYTSAAWWEGKISALTGLRMLVTSWVGNFIGCAFMVGMFNAARTYHNKSAYLIYAAQDKMHYPWGSVFVKGILANWLVGIATWMANAAQDLTGKFVGIWLPISAFAAIGFEHCIANMFLLPMAISQGAHITAEEFVWHNLIPATLGNWIGGAMCIATPYAFIYGRTPVRIANWWHQTVEPLLKPQASKKVK